jgi:hypothetical protein
MHLFVLPAPQLGVVVVKVACAFTAGVAGTDQAKVRQGARTRDWLSVGQLDDDVPLHRSLPWVSHGRPPVPLHFASDLVLTSKQFPFVLRLPLQPA